MKLSQHEFCLRLYHKAETCEQEPLALPAVTTEQLRQKQRSEVKRLVGEVPLKEKQQFQAKKLLALREFWSQAPEEDQKNMPF